MRQNFLDNTLYEMDNLVVLRGMNSETVDLIATDPPFNTGRNREATAGKYEDSWLWAKDLKKRPDQWKWNEVHPKWLEEIKDNHTALYHAIDAAKHCQGQNAAAFLCFLSVRLLEMHRILKPTGSLYLHCDPTANSYIRMAMDAIFGKDNFLNEIVWQRTKSHNDGKQYGRIHDTILFYSKSSQRIWNPVYTPHDPEYIKKFYRHQDERGPYQIAALNAPDISQGGESGQPWRNINPSDVNRHWSAPRREAWPEDIKPPDNYESLSVHQKLDALDAAGLIYWPPKGNVPRFKRYLSTSPGRRIQDVITDINHLSAQSKERTGSPDQKPLALYERIIKASSNEGDLVLDPFCGCATTIIAAQNLKRRWIGIDRREDARYHIVTRLMGISREERKRLEQYAADKDWLAKQTQRYEMHYQTEPPIRTDTGEQNAPKLAHVYPAQPENLLTHDQMKDILVETFGLQCWGCNYIPPDKRYLHLDHITPKSEGSTNDIDNRALLCQPCNSIKSNTMSLTALRKKNRQEGYRKDNEPIDLSSALKWTRNYMINLIRETPQ